jgi:hypothetical protein
MIESSPATACWGSVGVQVASGSAGRAEPTCLTDECDGVASLLSPRLRGPLGSRKEVATATVPLPEQPDLGQLRNQGRDLQRAVRAGDPSALALVAQYLSDSPPAAGFPLSGAHTILARRYGFASWARLRRHVEVIAERSWTPTLAAGGETDGDRFLRLSCLNFDDDDPAQRVEAVRLLECHPYLTATHIGVAAACADVDSVRRLLAVEPAAATGRCGPYGWVAVDVSGVRPPRSRHRRARHLGDGPIVAGRGGRSERWAPFTLLTGLFACDWAGQPAHPQAVSFARLLLTPTTGRLSTIGCSVPTTITSRCCSSSGLDTAAAVSGTGCWVRSWNPPRTCWAACWTGLYATTSASASRSWRPGGRCPRSDYRTAPLYRHGVDADRCCAAQRQP